MGKALSALGFRFDDSIAPFGGLVRSRESCCYSAPEAILLLLELQSSNVQDIRGQFPIPGRFE